MSKNGEVPNDFPDVKRRNFMVLETTDQKESLYHHLRSKILRALDHGYEDFTSEIKITEKKLEDGTIITEEITIRKPSRRFWMSIHEIVQIISELDTNSDVSIHNCYYHIRKLQEQDLLEQYPPHSNEGSSRSKRVRGMYFRTTARFFVSTTFDISTDLAEVDVFPPEVEDKAVELAQQVKTTGTAGTFEYNQTIGTKSNWFSVSMNLHDDGESIITVVKNVTSQKTEEDALRKSQERLELAFKSTDLAPWDWHININQMVFSDLYAEMLGYTLKELNKFAKKWVDLLHPEDRQMILNSWDQHVERKAQLYSMEYRIRTKSGHHIWVLERGRIIEWDEDGNPQRAAGTILDITHEKLVMEALDQSEERYRRLVNESLQGIAIFKDGRIVFANPAYAKTTGRSIKELLGMAADETWLMIHPDDQPELKRRSKLVSSPEPTLPRIRFRYIRPDGEIRWVESYVNIIEHDGSKALQSLEVDITEQWETEQALRESEKQHRTLVESITQSLIIVQGSELGIVYSNPATESFSGYTSDELKMMGSDWVVKVYYEANKESTLERLRSILDGRYIAPLEGYENEYTHKNGSHFWLRSYPSRIIYNGQPATMILLVDITEQWESEQAIRESEKQYRALVDSITQPLIIIQGPELGIVYSNPATETVSGYTSEELKEMGGDWVVKVYYAADKQTTRNDLLGILGGYESPFEGFENKFVHKNGTHFWLQSYPSRIIYHGQPAILILLVDITKMKDLEYSMKRRSVNYQMLFESTSDAMFLIQDNSVIDCNQSMIELFGCSKDQLIGKKHWQISPRSQPDKTLSKQKTLESLDKVLSGKPLILGWSYKKGDGAIFHSTIDLKQIVRNGDAIVQVIIRETRME